MKKCSRIKNPCKLCLQSVTNKTGLQCKGACKRWAHFSCLNYTPGKIQDIKAGIITIACPCPTCNTVDPKEIITNPPFTCENFGCPANMRAKCDNIPCPANNAHPIPKCGPIKIECPSGCKPTEPICPICPDQTPPPTQNKHGFDRPRSPTGTPVRRSASDADEPSCNTEKKGRSGRAQEEYEDRDCPMKTERAPKRDRTVKELPERFSQRSAYDPESCSMKNEGSFYREMQEKKRTEKTRSCTCVSMSKADDDKKKSFSDHMLCNSLCKESHKALLCNIQQLCSTVGHLSSQVKQLMSKMMK